MVQVGQQVADLNTARGDASASQAAPSTDGIIFIGSTGNHTNTVTNTEAYNGTSWTEVADLSQKRYRGWEEALVLLQYVLQDILELQEVL